jgi:hypothetical protein
MLVQRDAFFFALELQNAAKRALELSAESDDGTRDRAARAARDATRRLEFEAFWSDVTERRFLRARVADLDTCGVLPGYAGRAVARLASLPAVRTRGMLYERLREERPPY